MGFSKKTILTIALIGALVGFAALGATTYAITATSTTEFCLSCHTMQIPNEEYQSSIHYSNAKGFRAECVDCHLPPDTLGYLIAKIRATKDIYHEFITKKISTEEKYEAHRLEMAEMVWEQMRANNSASCRECHNPEAMDTYEQTEDTVKIHEYGIENSLTCIDCHKGIAHFPPVIELDSEAFNNLLSHTENVPADAKRVYTVEGADMGELGRINPAVQLELISSNDNQREVKISGYQMKGAEQVIYLAEGKRAIIAMLSEQGQAALTVSEFKADEYNNEWRSAELTATIDAPVLASSEPLWEYAEQLDNVYCAGCHAIIPSHHFTVNAWGPIAKGMGDRTDISALDLEILTKYFQNHAKDLVDSNH
ncbi:NapC/NirT family cytochrome c [Aestuariirhabdus sp. Z084]|uniref:NapC/NirT family cytochrome c n=1 Tax=Aestuariirhabdus haliotis TaxID=2918751 RepID=UPI00201B447C|nr:NapC/NirT family cytochrome c [Aestuariirhabdus haliotis]MCL6414717.1 NapC/NirT family cytochrome c [Aestuariirhabdus haliotis]MCL6418649.1 NapC/NirT family cytochrome c [Aestuariirhabdus haliotis]